MPDYFYHVAIELKPQPRIVQNPTDLEPPELSKFFTALRPFTNRSARRESRDPSYDSKRSDSKPNKSTNQPCDAVLIAAPTEIVPSNPRDHRFDQVFVEGIDVSFKSSTMAAIMEDIVNKGIGSALSGQFMKGRYQPLETAEPGWGIVHLYRDAEETPGLYRDSPLHHSDLWSDNPQRKTVGKPHPPPKDEECTSLCILAVPSYMTPSDFLAYVGEETCEKVSHFRMVRTTRANRYMVLLKFKHGKQAREWQYEWNGKIFNSMEPETCHVVFLKSVELIQNTNQPTDIENGTYINGTSYPRMTNDPFIPAPATTKPLAPRTPSLVELPTCPVCLERMDETTGLLTIPCQHVFHCTCLQKWSGGGCPVCRYTHDDFSSRLGGQKHKSKTPGEYEVDAEPLQCETCHVENSLWQCLICGKVGCGRYEGKHAYTHFEESGHTFSMDLESHRVWDYAGDGYVHRIIQDAAKPGEKLVELPGQRREPTALEGHEDIEMAKMENVALEYTHLLTSQLESQRAYFEEVVERAVDKAADATKKAERASEEAHQLKVQLQTLEDEHDLVAKGKMPELEKERFRLGQRYAKLEEMTKDVNQRYLEEKSLSKSLLERVKFLENSQIEGLQKRIRSLEEENATKDLLMEGLRDEHRDAMIQVSAERQLREMVERGEIDQEELTGATISAGPRPLTPRERLAKRLGKSVDRPTSKAPVKNTTQPPTTTQEGSTATEIVPSKPSLIDDVIASGFDPSVQRGENWDSDQARRMFAELTAKMIEQGMISAEKSTDDIQDENDEVSAIDLAGATTGKKKGKGKGKKKH